MKRAIVVFICMFIIILPVVSQLAEDELGSISEKDIEFVNYVGPHEFINSIEEIRSIGTYLGSNITQNPGVYSYFGSYSIIHSIEPETTDGFDADIFVIHDTARVDHVHNIRRIISSYIESAYGYNRKNADTLAYFVTIYNAVYRGNIDYLSLHYKENVMRHLSSSNAGMSKYYKDWPGSTRIIIPVKTGYSKGDLNNLDADEVSNDDVTEKMREDEDKGIDERKDMTEHREDAIEEDRDKLEEERGQIAEDREQLEEEKVQTEEQQQELEQERQDLETEKEELENIPDDEKTPEQLDREEQLDDELDELDEQGRELEAQEEQLDERESDLSQREEQAEEKQEDIVEREESLDEYREEIKEDEQTIIEQEEQDETADSGQAGVGTAAVERQQPEPVLFLLVSDDIERALGSLLMVDARSGKTLTESELNSIRGRKYYEFGSSIAVLAGTTSGGGAVRLMTLDPDTLEIQATGAYDAYDDSNILVDSNTLFAVVSIDGRWVLGSFDTDLELTAQSEAAVNPLTAVIASDGNILVQSNGGSILALSRNDLSTERVVRE